MTPPTVPPTLTVDEAPIDLLRPDPANPRRISEEELDALVPVTWIGVSAEQRLDLPPALRRRARHRRGGADRSSPEPSRGRGR